MFKTRVARASSDPKSSGSVPIASMGKQPREHFLHEDLAVFACPWRITKQAENQHLK